MTGQLQEQICTTCNKRPAKPSRKTCDPCRVVGRVQNRRTRDAKRQRELAANPCDCGSPSVSVREQACARCLFLDGYQFAGTGGKHSLGSSIETLIIEALRHEGECTVRHLATWTGKHIRAVVRSLGKLKASGRVASVLVEMSDIANRRDAVGYDVKLWRLVDTERCVSAGPPAPTTPGRSWQVASTRRLGFSRAA